MSQILIRGGRVLDPATDLDTISDVLIEDGRIAAVGSGLSAGEPEVVDASGCWVAPGFVDMHVHFRDPGQEYKEDIGSGGCSAVAGGFTAVACMANTHPVNDDPSVTQYILERARESSPARVYPIGAATKGLEGEVMTEMVGQLKAGAVAFSDDGKTIMDGGVMRRVLQYSSMMDVPIIVHAEDCSLVGNGVINEGRISTKLGLPGNPNLAEAVLVSRDIMLAELTGAHLHIAHVSTREAVDLIRKARERGLHVTAEVTPHHLALTDEATLSFDTNAKMAPPLRGEEDRKACVQGLVDGTLDCIATDHAPHAIHEKEVDFVEAANGVLGLETALPVSLDLVRQDVLSPLQLMRVLSTNAAQLLKQPGGSLAIDAVADVVVIDPEVEWIYDPIKGYSKGVNSPWAGETMKGRAVATIVDGRLVYDIDRGVLYP